MLTEIRRSLKVEAAPVLDEEDLDKPSLLDRLRHCEALVAELTEQLNEKTAHAEALRHELEERKRFVPVSELELDRTTVSYDDKASHLTSSPS